jgi:serine/threonine protein kinase/formylglycine-generating enzyme required for sulfatase activity
MTEAPANHPGDAALLALSLGQLAETDLAHVSSHLGDCAECCRRIDQLAGDDMLVALLQESAASPDQVPGTLRRLHGSPSRERRGDRQADARTMLTGGSAVHAQPDRPPPSPRADDLIRFLAAAERPDEVGRLGPYRILAVLGQGGMGVVFHAHDPALDRLVALKAMLPSVAGVPAARKRFLREAQAVAALKHPHVVTVFQVDEDRGVPFLAMEYLEGEPLDARIRREGQLPLADVLRIARETALGLAAAHARGLVHRDIKPANLWLEGPVGHVKILDFGLAQAASDQGHLTHFGVIVGTPAYMAPEQAEGKAVDPRCDLFSLGCVLYQMLSGTLPFQGATTIAVLRALALHAPAPLGVARPNAPPQLVSLVLRLLAKNPDDRPASAEEVAAALQTVEQLPPTHAASEPARTRPPRSRTPRLAVAGAMFAVALAALIFTLWPTPRGTVRLGSDAPAVTALATHALAPPIARAPFDARQASEHQTVWAKYLGLPVETTNTLGMKFRLIPPGEFMMGITGEEEEAWANMGPLSNQGSLSVPAHRVRLSQPFYIGEREVRYGEFLDLMKRDPGFGPKSPHNVPDGALLARCTWFDCIEFCNRLSEREGLAPAYRVVDQVVTLAPGAGGYRLPTEAEWEYACRAGTTSLWYFGMTAQQAQSRFARDEAGAENELRARTAIPNPFGLRNLYSGAAEWCWDWYSPTYYRECAEVGMVVDPRGPDTGMARICRGGTYFARAGGDLTQDNSAARVPSDPKMPFGTNGFGRLVLPIPANGRRNALLPP